MVTSTSIRYATELRVVPIVVINKTVFLEVSICFCTSSKPSSAACPRPRSSWAVDSSRLDQARS